MTSPTPCEPTAKPPIWQPNCSATWWEPLDQAAEDRLWSETVSRNEMLQKTLAKSGPGEFAWVASRRIGRKPIWYFARHLQYLSTVLRRAYFREPGWTRLIINWPPRHGKSLSMGTYLLPWWLGMDPDENVGYVTYQQQLSEQ